MSPFTSHTESTRFDTTQEWLGSDAHEIARLEAASGAEDAHGRVLFRQPLDKQRFVGLRRIEAGKHHAEARQVDKARAPDRSTASCFRSPG